MGGGAEIKRSVGAPRFFGKIWLCGGGSALVQIVSRESTMPNPSRELLLCTLVQIASGRMPAYHLLLCALVKIASASLDGEAVEVLLLLGALVQIASGSEILRLHHVPLLLGALVQLASGCKLVNLMAQMLLLCALVQIASGVLHKSLSRNE